MLGSHFHPLFPMLPCFYCWCCAAGIRISRSRRRQAFFWTVLWLDGLKTSIHWFCYRDLMNFISHPDMDSWVVTTTFDFGLLTNHCLFRCYWTFCHTFHDHMVQLPNYWCHLAVVDPRFDLLNIWQYSLVLSLLLQGHCSTFSIPIRSESFDTTFHPIPMQQLPANSTPAKPTTSTS